MSPYPNMTQGTKQELWGQDKEYSERKKWLWYPHLLKFMTNSLLT